MTNPLIRKLENFAPLSARDRKALDDAIGPPIAFASNQPVILQGQPTEAVNLVLDGLACRYKELPDGRRQIVHYFVPGDICDLRIFILRRMDHSIAAVGPCTIAKLPRDAVLDLTENHPALTRALWWATLVEEAIAREWITNIGARNALERTAHLFCELLWRLRAVGLAKGASFDLPVTQAMLGNTLGLSAVHVNRTLKALRSKGLATLSGGRLTIHEVGALADIALFDPAYLHLGGEDHSPHGGEYEVG